MDCMPPAQPANASNSETDYLVVGCGATALAFVDVMLRESDATFTIVDRRHAPGGHWNDAYPFVRLHQPSAYYGVASQPLGRGKLDSAGFNRGFCELATGTEVANYFHALMRDVLLPSGRVTYLPLAHHAGDGEVVSLLSGERRRIAIRKKLVDATRTESSIPLTHQRKFSLEDGVACIPPNDLVRIAPHFKRFAVLGAGKTAIDSATFLLANGVQADAITWVLPRDPWLYNRAFMQPGRAFFAQTAGGLAEQFEIFATAESIEQLAERMEDAGLWLRVDKNVWPTMIHGATVSEAEAEALGWIDAKVRLGRVQRIERTRMILQHGEFPMHPETLYIDCTASALGRNVHDTTPVFEPGKIALQMVRIYQPTFSAAVIGHFEATVADEAEKATLAQPSPMTDTLEDWLECQVASLNNQAQWSRNPAIAGWMAQCRLNAYADQLAGVSPADTEPWPVVDRLRKHLGPALQNLQRLAAEPEQS
jgi:hypothetical protein